MWLNEFKDLYRCYINFDEKEIKREIIKDVLVKCLNELNYDLFGISYSIFLKHYEKKPFDDLSVDVQRLFVNFNKSYNKLNDDLDVFLNNRKPYCTFDFEVILYHLIEFMYSESRVNIIKYKV